MSSPPENDDRIDEDVARVFAQWGRSVEAGDERHVQAILARARRQVVVRDLLTFSLVRVWTTVLCMTIEVCAMFKTRSEGPSSGDEPQ